MKQACGKTLWVMGTHIYLDWNLASHGLAKGLDLASTICKSIGSNCTPALGIIPFHLIHRVLIRYSYCNVILV